MSILCPECEGRRFVEVICKVCKGNRKYQEADCPNCGGAGSLFMPCVCILEMETQEEIDNAYSNLY